MPAWTHPIRPGLRPYVVSCVGYDWRLAPDAIHHGVPSLGLTLIFQFDEPLDCGWLDGTSGSPFNILLAGLHNAPALIRTHGRQHGIHVTLTPWGARALFDCPAAEFAHTMLPPMTCHPANCTPRCRRPRGRRGSRSSTTSSPAVSRMLTSTTFPRRYHTHGS
ncbi:DUF6597 domain-containing transcriptional factor [Arsenicicoccus bolidensis]|uniref:DUF6597 domain-containing transcriptional factor n=1 Tax=Arsenicicoccus bolidensis TaxID=229480 RepID=UPI00355922D5